MTGNALDPDHLAHLSARDPRLKPLCAHFAHIQYRLRPGGFPALIGLIVEQQLSVKAADTILARLKGGVGELTPQNLLDHSEESLRAYGLSRPKIAYARALAEAMLRGDLDTAALMKMDIETAASTLMAQKGIGRWTAEVYLMFAEGRLDLFPTGDVALREALGWLDGHQARPDEPTCAERARIWSPYRSVAAHLLWAWYGAVKRGEMTSGFLFA
ncbi:DNA-3-methyladenine glycosylase 2 family protein [Asticcacaulis sp. EMRT-3]|uniref:DNA-3-methyladenine glycosylase family protein n=1 Tax=Asticcacaulis sp. EMRT-3 TaxID=3040349 RepID=UPI0024AFFC20|nr:DNA-3-methyladenine glycosylase 2 family protein [Asticcacaulis sp. EMRT-3]MDI7776170.1 DNA-3-methyladenine glycosylase 2 family protein [Asticcacaulis sp. EMRT-3]